MGYSDAELAAVPDGANLGLGCGNPQAIAALKPGEVVIDLGSGAGFDCFLAARQVGASGRVIGVDMTHEMLKKARENAAKIERRQCRVSPRRARASAGRRQHRRRHPVQLRDQSGAGQGAGVPRGVPRAEAGRPARDLRCRQHRAAVRRAASGSGPLCGCIAGAAPVERIETWLVQAGFIDVRVTPKPESRELVASWAPGRGIEKFVVSATSKPASPPGTGPAVDE